METESTANLLLAKLIYGFGKLTLAVLFSIGRHFVEHARAYHALFQSMCVEVCQCSL